MSLMRALKCLPSFVSAYSTRGGRSLYAVRVMILFSSSSLSFLAIVRELIGESDASKSLKRFVPSSKSLMISRVHASPSSSATRATGQKSSLRSSFFIYIVYNTLQSKVNRLH